MKVKAASVAPDHALLSGGCSNSACNTDLGANSSKAIWEERYASTRFAIPPEPPRPFVFFYAKMCLFIRWYGQRGEGTLPVSVHWQQHPCVVVTPRAELSHLLAGGV